MLSIIGTISQKLSGVVIVNAKYTHVTNPINI